MNFAFELMLAEAAAQPSGGSPWGSFVILIPLFGLMYFLMIRPQRKKQQEHDEMLTRIKTGDKVMMTCGLFGKVTKVMDKQVTIDVNGTQMDFLPAAVAEIIADEEKKEETK